MKMPTINPAIEKMDIATAINICDEMNTSKNYTPDKVRDLCSALGVKPMFGSSKEFDDFMNSDQPLVF